VTDALMHFATETAAGSPSEASVDEHGFFVGIEGVEGLTYFTIIHSLSQVS